MIEILHTLTLLPGIILMLGALILPCLPLALRRVVMVALPIASWGHLLSMDQGEPIAAALFGLDMVPVRIDALALVWGHIFHIVSILGMVYALHRPHRGWEHAMGLSYAGAAIGAVFAGDLLTLFVYWELTGVTSVFLIWSREEGKIGAQGERSPRLLLRVGMRYLLVQVTSGVILLGGVLLRLAESDVTGMADALYFGHLFTGDLRAAPLPTLLILLAFGIKAAFPLLHPWLQDAYPRGTHTGTIFLSAFSTKMAIYALARGFAGTDALIWIGVVMTLFPIPFAVLENDLRKVLSYSLNNQLGFMVVGIGIGTELALNGAAAHAFAHILYKSLLFMSIGAVLLRVGTCRATELGGLYRKMPWTTVFCLVGAFSIAGFPLFSGFVSKSMTLSAVAEEHITWAFVGLLIASAGVMEHSGIKIPFEGFLGRGHGNPPDLDTVEEAPINMRVAMAIAAAFCIGIGIFPTFLWAILPYPVDYHAFTAPHIIGQFQLLFFAGLAFWALKTGKLRRVGLAYPKETKGKAADVDVLYRKVAPAIRDGVLAVARPTWFGLLGIGRVLVGQAIDLAHAWTGPRGFLGRSWTIGAVARWIVFGLVVVLLFLKR
ncbi:MAG: Na(+)/H(+) antiporter subunit D [Acidobacteriota bacterium]